MYTGSLQFVYDSWRELFPVHCLVSWDDPGQWTQHYTCACVGVPQQHSDWTATCGSTINYCTSHPWNDLTQTGIILDFADSDSSENKICAATPTVELIEEVIRNCAILNFCFLPRTRHWLIRIHAYAIRALWWSQLLPEADGQGLLRSLLCHYLCGYLVVYPIISHQWNMYRLHTYQILLLPRCWNLIPLHRSNQVSSGIVWLVKGSLRCASDFVSCNVPSSLLAIAHSAICARSYCISMEEILYLQYLACTVYIYSLVLHSCLLH